MKKIKVLALIFISTVTVVLGLSEVDAISVSDLKKTYGENGYTLLCDYDNVSIYYAFADANETEKDDNWFIFYNKDSVNTMHIGYKNFEKAFIKNKRVNLDGERFPASMQSTFTCPEKASIKFGWLNDEICFGSSDSCGKNFEGPYALDTSSNSFYKEVSDIANNNINKPENITAFRNGEDIGAKVRAKTLESIKKKYSIGTEHYLPAFMSNYINNVEITNTKEYKELQEATNKTYDANVANGTMTEEEAAKEKARVDNTTLEEALNKSISSGIDTEIRDGEGCNGVFGSDLTKIIKALFRFVQYLGPILVAVFSVVDFAKAALSGDPGDMKKASNKLVKRVVAAIMLFFIPIICNVIFEFAGLTVPDFCLDKPQ